MLLPSASNRDSGVLACKMSQEAFSKSRDECPMERCEIALEIAVHPDTELETDNLFVPVLRCLSGGAFSVGGTRQ